MYCTGVGVGVVLRVCVYSLMVSTLYWVSTVSLTTVLTYAAGKGTIPAGVDVGAYLLSVL